MPSASAAVNTTSATSPDAGAPSTVYARLHITPFDPDLVKVVLNSSLQPKARNISFHNLETFPEKRYGFVEIPSEDAEKLKQKLNGAFLKGVKVRIENARPAREILPMGDAAFAEEKTSKKKKCSHDGKTKKRKRDAEELSGVEIEEGRKVKRGWTVTSEEVKAKKEKERQEKKKDKSGKDKDKKDKDKKEKKDKKIRKEVRSKYTDQPECLVKTILPPNVAAANAKDGGSSKKRKSSREVVVHEFEKTTKVPTFLKSSAPSVNSKPALEFVDGKGWVDEDGNVVEAVKRTSGPIPGVKSNKKAATKTETQASEDDSGSSSDESGEDEQVSDAKEPIKASHDDDEGDHSISLAKLGQISSQPDVSEAGFSSPLLAKSDPTRPQSSASIKSLSIKIPPTTPGASKQIHPLEALYKRTNQVDGTPSQPPQEPASFSFFDNVGNNEDIDKDDEEQPAAPGSQAPMTPFTRQDFEQRGLRSAAPTPDTAHPSRRFRPWSHDDEDDIEEEQDETLANNGQDGDEDMALEHSEGGQATDAAPSTDFQKWFYEHKKDLRKSWKQRRRLAAKDKRYRDNKARAERAV